MTRGRCLPWVLTATILAALAASGDARAQGAADKAAAETLFEEGRKLMAAGNAAAACPKFASSQKLDPGLGTLLNLGDCYEKVGKIASAWAQFKEAASIAESSGDSRRADVAHKRASALEPRLSRLSILAPAPAPPGLKVWRDGTPIDAALLGMALPVDAGQHVIEAMAPGKKSWRTELKVEGDKASVSAQIPQLEDEPAPAPPVRGTTPSATPIRPDSGAEPGPGGGWSTQRKIAIVSGGVGVVSLAVSGVLGLSARSKWQDAQDRCPGGHCTTQADVDLGSDARSSANLSTVFFGVGLAGLAAGAVLWLTSPDGKEQARATSLSLTPHTGPGLTGLSLRGGF
ncbi:MAG: hypothetical protein HY898_21470 [Deltaproteobacteria bacterium]|nr:hypothetical protein [Deltaproteobacteria bacterium]